MINILGITTGPSAYGIAPLYEGRSGLKIPLVPAGSANSLSIGGSGNDSITIGGPGIPGPVGPAGPQGIQGPQGVQGEQGPAGGTDPIVAVKLTPVDYTISTDDAYIGATEKNITLTLPPGVLGQLFYIKNQSRGNITVVGSNEQTLDASSFKTLGAEAAFICVFDGTQWNII